MKSRKISDVLALALGIVTLLFAIAILTSTAAKADSVIATIPVGTGPYGALFNPLTGHVYTADLFSNTISVIDTSTNKVIDTIKLPNGYTPRELALDSKRNYIYTANVYSNTLSVVDAANDKVIDNITSSGSIVDGVAYDSVHDHVFAVNAGSGTVSVIDASTRKVIDTISVGSNPLTDIFIPSNGYIYVANQLSQSVSVIDPSTNKVINTITGIPNPIQLGFDPDNEYIYVVNYDDTNVVSVIDSKTNKVINTIPGFTNPAGVTFNSDNHFLYVANQGKLTIANTVSKLNPSTNNIDETITVGSGPVTPVYNPATHNVYVTNFHSNEAPGNTVSVISTSSVPPTPVVDTIITSALDGNDAPIANNVGSTVSNKITFTFTGVTNNGVIAGFECRLDSSAFSSCTSPKTYSGLAAGDHTFQVRAIDSLGNNDPTPATFKWKVLTPAQGIQKLIDDIKNNASVPKKVKVDLIARLQTALRLLTDNNPENDDAVCGVMLGFTKSVDNFGKRGVLTLFQTSQLNQQAIAILKSLGCPIEPGHENHEPAEPLSAKKIL